MKLRRKLFMSTAALAACAATLTTTTYAWYVTNATASIGSVTGSTNQAGSDGSIYLANGNSTSAINSLVFKSNVDFADDTNNTGYGSSGKKLEPASKARATTYKEKTVTKDNYSDAVTAGLYTKSGATYTKITEGQFDADTTYYEVAVNEGQWIDKDGALIAGQVPYMQFTFWVMSSKQQDVNWTFTAKNTTGNDKVGQILYNSEAGAPSGVTIGSTFNAEVLCALRMEVFKQDYSTKLGDSTSIGTYAVDEAGTNNVYNTDYKTDGDANQYYKLLTGKAAANTDASTGTSTDANSRTAARTSAITFTTTYTMLTFIVWLEGSDKNCFDSCVGQNFTFDFNFSVPQTQSTN